MITNKEAESRLYWLIVECKAIAENQSDVQPTYEHIKALWDLYQTAVEEEFSLAAKVHEYECREERYD